MLSLVNANCLYPISLQGLWWNSCCLVSRLKLFPTTALRFLNHSRLSAPSSVVVQLSRWKRKSKVPPNKLNTRKWLPAYYLGVAFAPEATVLLRSPVTPPSSPLIKGKEHKPFLRGLGVSQPKMKSNRPVRYIAIAISVRTQTRLFGKVGFVAALVLLS